MNKKGASSDMVVTEAGNADMVTDEAVTIKEGDTENTKVFDPC